MEAFVGEYASGKSENAVNRALFLAKQKRKVCLVDLDMVEPCFTLRPLQEKLSEKGMEVISWRTRDTFGLGEAGSTLKPEARWALKRSGDVILDIGYGVHGSRILNLLEGSKNLSELKVIAVINIYRPFTSTLEQIISHVQSLSRVNYMLNNSHLGKETKEEHVQKGARMVTEAARQLGLPVFGTAAECRLAGKIGKTDCMHNPIIPLSLYMSESFW